MKTTPTTTGTPTATAVEPVPHVKAPTVITEPKKKNAPTGLIVLFSTLLLASGIFILVTSNSKNKSNKSGGSSISIADTKPEETQTWTTHSLSKPGDSVKMDIPYGWHIHPFSVNNKMYGCHFQGGTRQVIGNGTTYDPYPIHSRYVYIYFEKEAEDIDFLTVKNGKCPYDDF